MHTKYVRSVYYMILNTSIKKVTLHYIGGFVFVCLLCLIHMRHILLYIYDYMHIMYIRYF